MECLGGGAGQGWTGEDIVEPCPRMFGRRALALELQGRLQGFVNETEACLSEHTLAPGRGGQYGSKGRVNDHHRA